MLWAYWVTAKDWIRQTATVPTRWYICIFLRPPSSCEIFFKPGNTMISSCMMIDIEI